METLIKVDSEKHMYRWYSVGIQSTLVDGIAIVHGWGSLKSSFQQWRTVQVSYCLRKNLTSTPLYRKITI